MQTSALILYMCRFMTYLGPELRLERIVSESEHSLVVQSYQPQEILFFDENLCI